MNGETVTPNANPSANPKYPSGALTGAGAGALLSLLDLTATAGLVDGAEARLDLFVRLLLVAAPLGALIGVAFGAAHAFGERLILQRAAARGQDGTALVTRWSPLPISLLLSPLMAVVAWLSFSGPAASRLALRPLFVAFAFFLLFIGSWGALRACAELRRAAETPARRALVTVLAVFAAVAASRADQVLYPALYDHLHACLTAVAFGALWLAVDQAMPRSTFGPKSVRASLAVVAILSTAFILNLSTLGMSQTVRPILLDPRASHVRSAMLGLGPLLAPAERAPEDAIARARSARSRRRAALSRSDLPTWEDAHLLLITIDALRPDHLGFEGYARPTSPNLDRFADNALVFDRAYAQAPHSSYSLASVMTSEYLHEVVEIGAPLPDETLSSVLSAAGYRTSALFPLGVFHTEGERLTQYAETRFDFDRTNVADLDARARTDSAIEELDEIARAGEPKSFTWVHYFDVHEPYEETRFGHEDVDRYDSEIAHVDAELGRLLEAAEERLAGELIVVVSADHGEEFREHGGVYHGFTLYEEQIRVPLLVRAPGLSPAHIGAPVELVDLAPTLLGMVGVEPPRTMRGDDLRALALGRINDVGPAFAGVGPRRMVVAHPYKLVANLRFGVFELFDLTVDPRERDNLAGDQPERLATLKAELFAWLDSLSAPPDDPDGTDPRAIALRRGRLGDRRATALLIEIIEDDGEDPLVRAEAARILGVLGDSVGREPLAGALEDDTTHVRAEAAIALGRLYDPRAAEPLAALVTREMEPARRARAAIALARLGDRRSIAALPDAAVDAPSRREQNEAVHFLGELGGPDQLEPLLALLADFDSRRPAAVALGRLGDARALPSLLNVLDHEDHANIRDAVVRGLGHLGAPGAIPRLVTLLSEEPELRSTSEALVRLDAVGTGAIGGADIGPDTELLIGFRDCEATDLRHGYHFSGRTHCVATGDGSVVPLRVPKVIREAVDGVELVVRLSRADGTEPDSQPERLVLFFGDDEVARLEVDDGWVEHHVILPPTSATREEVALRIEAPFPVRFDHALLVPRSTRLASSALH